MDEKKKKELKAIIEGTAYNLYDDMMNAKSDIDDLAKASKDIFLIEPAIFKKLVKLHYDKSIEAERRKFNEIDELYIEIFGLSVDEPSLFDKEITEDRDRTDKDETFDKISYGLKGSK